MFQRKRQQTGLGAAFSILRLIYHNTVRHVRKSHGNPLIGLFLNVMQTLILVAVFYIMFEIIGMRAMAVRGDFVLFLLSGIFLFMTHNKAVAAVAGAEGPTSPMMLHAPMNTMISVFSAALSVLYLQTLSVVLILFFYDLAVAPVVIYDPIGAFAMFLLSWFSGVAIGMVLLALKPWAPGLTSIIQQFYTRANMVTSGKMFVANQMPGYILSMFMWNPLFHCIDQARAFAFVNYSMTPSDIMYPVYFSIVFIMIGLIAEFFTRRRASLSWSAGK